MKNRRIREKILNERGNMATKSSAKKANKLNIVSQVLEDSQQSIVSRASQRNRAKKYSKAETDTLLKICAGFHGIINKNSNSDADRKIKTKAWEKIKQSFDSYCRSQGIVSFF